MSIRVANVSQFLLQYILVDSMKLSMMLTSITKSPIMLMNMDVTNRLYWRVLPSIEERERNKFFICLHHQH